MLHLENDFDVAAGECPVDYGYRARVWRRIIVGIVGFWTGVGVLCALFPVVAKAVVILAGVVFGAGIVASIIHWLRGCRP